MRTWTKLFCSLFALSALVLDSSAIAAAPNQHSQAASSAKAKKTAVVKKKTTKVVTSKSSVTKKQTVAKTTKTNKRKPQVAASNKSVRKVAKTSTSRKFAASQNRPAYSTRHVRGPSYAQLQGLRGTSDPLGLATTAVLVYDMDSNEVLYEKNADQPLPIASVTKLMTALVIVESGIDLNQKFQVTRDDFVASSARSKLRMGMVLSRKQALHLALMSSDNRAAHFLGRTYPGGLSAFIRDMNTKAVMLGMPDTVFYDSIGLNNGNKASALDLARLLANAAEYEIIRELSTTSEAQISAGRYTVTGRTTNALVRNQNWDIELQKTGLTTAAGYCLVMQTHINDRTVAMIFLDAPNKYARTQDAEKVKAWLSTEPTTKTASSR